MIAQQQSEGDDESPEPTHETGNHVDCSLSFAPLRHYAVLGPAGGLGAERRYGEHRGENRSSAAHIVTSPSGRTGSISSLPAPGNGGDTGQWASGKSASGLGCVKTRDQRRLGAVRRDDAAESARAVGLTGFRGPKGRWPSWWRQRAREDDVWGQRPTPASRRSAVQCPGCSSRG